MDNYLSFTDKYFCSLTLIQLPRFLIGEMNDRPFQNHIHEHILKCEKCFSVYLVLVELLFLKEDLDLFVASVLVKNKKMQNEEMAIEILFENRINLPVNEKETLKNESIKIWNN